MASFEKRGSKWRARIRTIGLKPLTRTFSTKKAAEAWARTVEASAHYHVQKHDTGQRVRFAELLDRYEIEVTPLKKSHRQERHRIMKWKQHPIARLPIDELASYHFAQYRNERMADGASNNTIRLELALVSHLLNIARREWGFSEIENHVQNITKPPAGRGRERRLSLDEEKRLLRAAFSRSKPWLGHMIVLAIETALRKGEILDLRWNYIDYDTNTLNIPETKNGDSKRIPLSTRAVETLKSVEQTHERVFPLSSVAVRMAFDRARIKAGLPDFRFHDLRHEVASRLVELGLNTLEVASITGHRSMQMLKRYSHPDPKKLAEKIRQLSDEA